MVTTSRSGTAVAVDDDTAAVGAVDDAGRMVGDRGTALVPSVLSDRLEAHPDALRAFRSARHRFIDGDRIDMGRLATELGVDRTSLFRWVGNRDQLLSEVLWSLAVPTLDAADRAVDATGPARIIGVLSHFVGDLIDASYFRVFLTREPSRALRLLTTTDSDVQRRFIAVVTALIDDEVRAARFDPAPLSTHELASLLVRISESFTYADLISGEPPSADRARAAFEYILRPTTITHAQQTASTPGTATATATATATE